MGAVDDGAASSRRAVGSVTTLALDGLCFVVGVLATEPPFAPPHADALSATQAVKPIDECANDLSVTDVTELKNDKTGFFTARTLPQSILEQSESCLILRCLFFPHPIVVATETTSNAPA